MISIYFYVLDREGKPKAEPDVVAWARWMQLSGDERIVGKTPLADDVMVSTVFLGLDHRFYDDGPPVLWETMIFRGPHDGEQWRYTSRAEALEGHTAAVKLALGGSHGD